MFYHFLDACYRHCIFFFFKQKTAYEMRISDWSSDVCSSDLTRRRQAHLDLSPRARPARNAEEIARHRVGRDRDRICELLQRHGGRCDRRRNARRSEEHTSELQSLMRISYAVFCLKKKKKQINTHSVTTNPFTPLKATSQHTSTR